MFISVAYVRVDPAFATQFELTPAQKRHCVSVYVVTQNTAAVVEQSVHTREHIQPLNEGRLQ
jgi:hypothetical protein